MTNETITEILSALALAGATYGLLLEVAMQLIKPAIKAIQSKVPIRLYPAVIALLLGIVMALGLNVDFASSILLSHGINLPQGYAIVGNIISGLFIGRVSNLIHDLWPGSSARTKTAVTVSSVWNTSNQNQTYTTTNNAPIARKRQEG